MDVLEEETNSEISQAMRPLNSDGEIPNQRVDQSGRLAVPGGP